MTTHTLVSTKFPNVKFEYTDESVVEITKELAGAFNPDGTPTSLAEVLNYELRNLESVESFARDLFFRWNGEEYDDTNPAHASTRNDFGHEPWFKINIGTCRSFSNHLFTASNILDDAASDALRYYADTFTST
jgi:hypothetical protein